MLKDACRRRRKSARCVLEWERGRTEDVNLPAQTTTGECTARMEALAGPTSRVEAVLKRKEGPKVELTIHAGQHIDAFSFSTNRKLRSSRRSTESELRSSPHHRSSSALAKGRCPERPPPVPLPVPFLLQNVHSRLLEPIQCPDQKPVPREQLESTRPNRDGPTDAGTCLLKGHGCSLPRRTYRIHCPGHRESIRRARSLLPEEPSDRTCEHLACVQQLVGLAPHVREYVVGGHVGRREGKEERLARRAHLERSGCVPESASRRVSESASQRVDEYMRGREEKQCQA